mgnify:CR=1 FL=1
MKGFAELYAALDRATATRDKLSALLAHFSAADPLDAAWAVYVLGGGKLKRLLSSTELRALAAQASGYPGWLIDETYAHVGDLAETLALVLGQGRNPAPEPGLSAWVSALESLRGADAATRSAHILATWQTQDENTRLVYNKLVTGALRIGVSRGLLHQALARLSGLSSAEIAHRLSGEWQVSAENWRALIDPTARPAEQASRPYPFFLASPLEDPPHSLGARSDWLAEWKWDGIRAQLIRRAQGVEIWSRGEERLDGRFPELEVALQALPSGTVLDGEILAWRDSAPLAFQALQRRIGRLKPGPKLLSECPVRFLAYDLLEHAGEDCRSAPLHVRRAELQSLLAACADPRLGLSPAVDADSWEALATRRTEARERAVEGLMLKRWDSPYQVGRKRGDWWKWKIDALHIDAVLIYAQAGHGRRANLYTDYTFAVWDQERLVPIAKAYSGLDDREIAELDRWIRRHTLERFGPVRSVEALLVFELAFEGIQVSTRHKSGVALRFPRIARWRIDKTAAQADTLEALRALAHRRD